jgi:hypothetical protein
MFMSMHSVFMSMHSVFKLRLVSASSSPVVQFTAFATPTSVKGRSYVKHVTVKLLSLLVTTRVLTRILCEWG